MTSLDHPSQVEMLEHACAATGGVLANVTDEQMTLRTPCTDWQVRDVINHIIGATRFFADLAEWGSSPEEQEWPVYADGDFAASFAEQSRRVISGFSAPGAMDRMMALPTGPAPGSRCIEVASGEIIVHGWDLAKATGQATPADQGVAEALLSSAYASLCVEVRSNDPPPFASEIGAAPGAAAIDRLAAFLGRDPGWSASQ
jgi:uncharacterized protein (TIGR03086 family)